MNDDQCEFCQEDLCSAPYECRFQDFTDCDGNERIVPSCTATSEDLMTEEEWEAMQKLQSGVQKIFRDAVGRAT